jgi:uncharacterized lipoprotein YmbA
MKKILSITMMMVAIMVATFSFVSCSSDDDKNNGYRLEVSLKIEEASGLTPEQREKLEFDAAKKSDNVNYPSDEAAQTATGMVVSAMAEELKNQASQLGDAVLTYTIKCVKSNGTQIITYYLTYDKGEVDYYNNKN